MRFTVSEYETFDTWFNSTLKFGLYPFYFPKIDSTTGTNAIYRFTSDGAPQYSNPSGKFIDCSMKWEEL